MNNMNNLSSNNHPILPNQSLISQTSTPKASQITVGVYSEGSAKVEKHLGETQLFQKMRMENSNYLGFKSLEREVIELKHSFSQFEESIQTLESEIDRLKTQKSKESKIELKRKVEDKKAVLIDLAKAKQIVYEKLVEYTNLKKQFNEEPVTFEKEALEQKMKQVVIEIENLNTEINELENQYQSKSNGLNELENKAKSEIKKLNDKKWISKVIHKVESIWLSFMKRLGFNKNDDTTTNNDKKTIDNKTVKLRELTDLRDYNLTQHQLFIQKWVEKEEELNKLNSTMNDQLTSLFFEHLQNIEELHEALSDLEMEPDLDLVLPLTEERILDGNGIDLEGTSNIETDEGFETDKEDIGTDEGVETDKEDIETDGKDQVENREDEVETNDIENIATTKEVKTDRKSVDNSNRPQFVPQGLMSQIETGTKLKPIDNSNKPPSLANQRKDLLKEIERGGKQLKKVDKDKVSKESVSVSPEMQALLDKTKVFKREEIDSDSDSEDEKWL